MTVADVIERIYRDYLTPPGEQPTRFKVGSGGITASATTLPVSTALLSPEEEGLIGAGQIIELGTEWMMVEAVTGTPPTSITVRRGMYGTTAAIHAADDLITLAPDFPRRVVFDSIGDVVEGLWPKLWSAETTEIVGGMAPVDLPANCEEILEVRGPDSAGRWALLGGWELVTGLPVSATGKSIQFMSVGNQLANVKYRAAATRPTDEDDTLSDLGISESWVKAICVGVVAQVIARVDIDKASVEFITKALESEGMRVGEGADLRNALLQYHQYLVTSLAQGLEASQPSSVVIYPEF